MKAKEIIQLLDDSDISPREFYDEGLEGYLDDIEEDDLAEIKTKLGEIEVIDEGIQDDMDAFKVYHYKDHDVYIKMIAVFDSYEAYHNAEDFGKEVFPKEITKTIYE